MFFATKLFPSVVFCVLLIVGCSGQRGGNRNKNNKPNTGGRFVPGKTKLSSSKSSSNPRARGPTLGDILRASGVRPNNRRGQQGGGGRGGGGGGGRGGNPNRNVDHSNPDAVNLRNFINNLKNNNKGLNNNHNANTGPQNQAPMPNIGKVVPPLRRSEGEQPPFAPSWTHCVISIQVSIAWVVVKSPNYPKKFQGQVQCSWIATAPEGYRVRLSFKDLDLLVPNGKGCGSQFVEVIDMDLQKSQARFCGTDIPGDYVSEGSKLRLDLQADAISTPYRGFMAAFRADQEIPGRRETSYYAYGQPQLMYNPLTSAPPSNPQYQTPQRRARRPITTRAPIPTIAGQRIYGRKDQPRYQKPQMEEEDDALESSTTHLYIIIAVILVILVAAAAAYIFKRYFYTRFTAWWKKTQAVQDGIPMEATDDDVYGRKTQLPGYMPLPPTPGQVPPGLLRRQSVSFKDGDYPVSLESDPHYSGSYPLQALPPPYPNQFGSLQRSHSLGDISQMWMQEHDEPIYEGDAMSVHSVASTRSSNRHPDHERLKHQKLLERQNSLRLRRNSTGSEYGGHYPIHSGAMLYPMHDVYNTNSLYSGQVGANEYPVMQENPYGSLPPTLGPGANGIYGVYQKLPVASHHPLYTSSMTDLTSGNTGNFMMQQYNGRSASVYDLASSPPQVQEMPSQWSTQLDQRHPSLTSSTNTSSATNPILKKTKPQPHNEFAFTALRSAKSMNDLTAINTKLNECVSWTLPSQRRKSFVDLS